MSELFEIDPISGIKTTLDWNAGDTVTVKRYAEVAPHLDAVKDVRNELGLNRNGIQESWWCYASIPPAIQLELRAKGLIVGRKEDEARIIAEINTNYPYLKMTTGKMGSKVKTYA